MTIEWLIAFAVSLSVVAMIFAFVALYEIVSLKRTFWKLKLLRNRQLDMLWEAHRSHYKLLDIHAKWIADVERASNE